MELLDDVIKSPENSSVSLDKILPLFETDPNDLIDENGQTCYDLAFSVVTSSGILLVVAFNANRDFVHESCSILSESDLKATDDLERKREEPDSSSEKFVVTSAKFGCDRSARYITYLNSSGVINIVKFSLHLLGSNIQSESKSILSKVHARTNDLFASWLMFR